MTNEYAVAIWQNTTNRRYRNEAMKTILTKNGGIIYGHSKKVIDSYVNFDDFKQEAAIQAMRNMDNFDLSRGLKFCSYFAHTTKAAIAATNQTAEIIRPRYKPKKEHGPLEGKQYWLRQSYQSINDVNEEGFEFGDQLEAPREPEKTDIHKFIEPLFHILSPMQKTIIKHSFGIGCTRLNNSEIGDLINLCRERVRQIKDQSLDLMRTHAKHQRLKGNKLFNEISINLAG